MNKIKDPCIDKAYKKNRLVVQAYNDNKNLELTQSPKIQRVSQDITQSYVEFASDINRDFYTWLPFQLKFDFIFKVMKPLYGEPKADTHRFAIYHSHYKEKPGMTKLLKGQAKISSMK